MSKYQVHVTKFTNKLLLAKAFEEVCKQRKIKFEQHDVAVPLVGYLGDQRQERGNFIIRRQYVGIYANDFGLVWDDQDSCYKAIVSNNEIATGNGTALIKALKQEYANQQIMSVVQKRQAMGDQLSIVWDKQKDGSRLVRVKGVRVS